MLSKYGIRKTDTALRTVTVLGSREAGADLQNIINKRLTLDLGGQTLS